MPTTEYNHLCKNIAKITRGFLNFDKRSDGNYSWQELMLCRAFISFCHAEFEHYLEQSCLRVILKAENHWQKHGNPTTAIAALLAYRMPKPGTLPAKPSEQGSGNRLATLIGNVIASQRMVVSGNHGIKPANISQLFMPLGVNPNQVPTSLEIQLEEFGKKRGDQVHQSTSVSLRKIRDPFDDELKDVNYLLAELLTFDAALRRLR